MDIINKIKNIDKDDKCNLYVLYTELKNNNDTDYLDYLFYSLKKFEYEYIEIIEKDETIEQREKRLDTNYRNIIREKYKTCMITGKPLCISQVAHIYPHTLCKPYEKYDQDNGLLLSAELHLLFDNFQFKINPDTLIMTFSQDILEDNTMSYYRQYNNKKIELSDKQKYYLQKKYDEFVNQ